MASLQNEQIDLSYQGLIKTTDNAALPVNGKAVITDGVGNPSVLELGQQEAGITNATLYSGAATIGSDPINDQFVYGGTQDFSGATVIGVGGAAGLVAGTGADSMKSADSLTTVAPVAAASNAIAIGNDTVVGIGATASIAFGQLAEIQSTNGVVIGYNADIGYSSNESVVIGSNALASGSTPNSVVIGRSAKAYIGNSVAIGNTSYVTGTGSGVAIGNGARVNGGKSIAIGTGNTIRGGATAATIIIGDALGDTYNNDTIAIGHNYPTSLDFRGNSVSLGNAIYPSERGVYVGNGANHTLGGAKECVAIGEGATTSANQAISLGASSLTTASNSVALGYGVTAAIANTVSIKELECQTVGGGIILYSPNGTAYKITVSDAGALVVA